MKQGTLFQTGPVVIQYFSHAEETISASNVETRNLIHGTVDHEMPDDKSMDTGDEKLLYEILLQAQFFTGFDRLIGYQEQRLCKSLSNFINPHICNAVLKRRRLGYLTSQEKRPHIVQCAFSKLIRKIIFVRPNPNCTS